MIPKSPYFKLVNHYNSSRKDGACVTHLPRYTFKIWCSLGCFSFRLGWWSLASPYHISHYSTTSIHITYLTVTLMNSWTSKTSRYNKNVPIGQACSHYFPRWRVEQRPEKQRVMDWSRFLMLTSAPWLVDIKNTSWNLQPQRIALDMLNLFSSICVFTRGFLLMFGFWEQCWAVFLGGLKARFWTHPRGK